MRNHRKLITILAASALLACSILAEPANLAATETSRPDIIDEITTSIPGTLTAIAQSGPTAAPTATYPFPVTRIPDAAIPSDLSGYGWQLYAGGFHRPVDLTHAGDGSGRVFVVEQAGVIWSLVNGQRAATPFLDISKQVGSRANEQGLLGLAFHPRYAETGYFFVNYTDKRGDTVIARFQVSADPNLADPASEMRLLEIEQPYSNHNGGGLAFGLDGYLYIGLGDGGKAGDPLNAGQSTNMLLGKLLRLDVDGGEPYAIPADNPFANGGGLPEVWAYGLRNPWRFSFDRLTGDLYIGDVGQNLREEINFLPGGIVGGANFGWNYREGLQAYAGAPPAGTHFTDPIIDYGHTNGNCSVTGGVVYRGTALPAWQGVYLYGDYCSGLVWGMVQRGDGIWQNQLVFRAGVLISSFGMDEAGEVYLVSHNGAIYRLGTQ
ncbi:MAG: PQQ-dependent sugar dehydrogenase [Anaerolineae bacterium]|nr:PQQ-dependent sugar dehydrogenase [Anaerolineae bacterium]